MSNAGRVVGAWSYNPSNEERRIEYEKYLGQDISEDTMLASTRIEEKKVNYKVKRDFIKKLEHLINIHNMEADSDTPDFILAEYLFNCLNNFAHVTNKREEWYGRERCEHVNLKETS